MAKTESTAVNELIDLVQNQTSKPEPSEDLFGPPKTPPTTRVNPPRMTATIPPMRGAGELPPLPRTRSAGGTSQHKLPDVPPPQVRMSTAPPTRGQTIPPIPHAPARASAPVPPSKPASLPPPRPSSPGLPAPVRNTSSAPVISARSTPSHPAIPEVRPAAKPALPTPKGTRPPAGSPVAAPFEPPAEQAHAPQAPAPNPFVATPLAYPVVQRPARIDMTGDAVSAENWFEASRAVEKFEEETFIGTSPVVRQERRRNETMALLGKMIVPTILLVIVGILIGGYIAFNGEGGAKKPAPAAKQPSVAQAEPAAKAPAKDTAPQPSTESANAATATAGGEQPEPPAKADDSGKVEAKAEPEAAKAEPAPAKAETAAKAEPASVKAEPASKAEPAKAEAAKVEPAKAEAAKVEPAPAKAETAKPAPAQVAAATSAAASPAMREVQTTRGVVKLADIRIDSKPSGATVMLVDNGKTSFLGTTPLATSLDPSRQYDLVFTVQGRPTQMAHLDPAKTPHLEMTLGKTVTEVKAPAAPAVAKTEPAPAPAHHHAAKASAPTAALADPGFDTAAPKAEAPKKEKVAKVEKTEKAEPAKTEPTKTETKAEKSAKADKTDKTEKADKAVAETPKAEPAKGTGTLMVSSKPPCEILIDGKATGLSTPQRAIPLPPGTHKVTFVNSAQNINKTVAVSISADQTTKLVKDLLQ